MTCIENFTQFYETLIHRKTDKSTENTCYFIVFILFHELRSKLTYSNIKYICKALTIPDEIYDVEVYKYIRTVADTKGALQFIAYPSKKTSIAPFNSMDIR